jgi:hypothetical protein
MPSPRRIPPTESGALSPARSGVSAGQFDPAGAGPGSASGPGVTSAHDAATTDLRRPTPRNSPAAAERPSRPHTLPTEPDGSSHRGHAGNQRSFGPSTGRRPETAGSATVPPRRPLLPGLHLQPMVHVGDMAAAVAFYETMGGEINHGDRDGEWVLMQVGTAQIGLVTRPPDASRGESTVELNFAATMPLDQLEQLLRERGVTIVAMAADRDLGTQLQVEAPDGMPIKIHQVEPELLV